MSKASKGKSIMAKFLGFFLAIAMVFTMMPLNANTYSYAAENEMTLQTPELVVTGSAVIGNGGVYSADNVGLEKSYTRDQLKQMVTSGAGGADVLYSAQKTKEPYTKLLYRATGVWVTSLLEGTAYDASTDVLQLIASDGYVTSFNPARKELQGTKINGLNVTRYAFPGIMKGDEANAKEVPAMLAYASTESDVKDPETAGAEKNQLTLHIGQEIVTEHNNGAYAKKIKTMVGGDKLTEVALTVGSETFTRADVLAMPYAERTFNYTTSNGDATDNVKGVPMSVLLEGCNENDTVNFEAADGYAVAASGMTVKQLIDGNFILGYEVNGQGLYSTKKKAPSVYGFFNLYGDGDAYAKPAKLVNKISVVSSEGIDFAKSPYKHITNGGQSGSSPYNIDAITGATLTVEGPGVKSSVPLPVRDLEGQNKGAVRGVYTDERNGKETTRSYEGIDLYYILNNMQTGTNGIILTDKAKKVEIKNRNRRTIATLTIDEINKMHESDHPAIVAYGTANEDGTNERPFVYNGATGEDLELGNNDGCLKLVCDTSSMADQTYKTFGNMAYIYVEEDTTPGFKHDKEPYNHKDNTKYIVTLTGDKMGKEALYTVDQLEDMVTYDADGNVEAGGIGYRDEYSLANSTYWYVNTYEGVKLWDLLVKSGLDPALADDDSVKVSFGSTDNYTGFDTFTTKQLADPNNFKFYEKNAADLNDGKYESTDEADLIKAGYPVLLSYGVNGYPYVKSSKLDGYLSGLQNDGGPLRVIWGKTSYNHANGSNQAKLVDRIFVGGNTYHYATHKYTDAVANQANQAQSALQDNKITVNIYNGAGDAARLIKSKEYTVGDIEEIIYDGGLTANQKKVAAVKNFYEVTKNGSTYSDIYEGINLNYFLENEVELPGAEGTISFNGADALDLGTVLSIDNGVNNKEGISGLTPVLAYGKNGYPLVTDKGAGFVEAANNNNGPLQVIIPSKSAGEAFSAYNNVTEISINLTADKYAHINAPYDNYKNETLEITGDGARNNVTLTVADLEGKQKLAQTTTFSIKKNNKGTVSETYRGFNLYNLLNSTTVGLKSSANGIIVTDTNEATYKFSMDDIRKMYTNTLSEKDVPVMLAYGINIDGTEYPLVPQRDSEGYATDAGKVIENHGGPLKLIIGQTDKSDSNGSKCIKNVAKIEITAAETASWTHDSGVFTQYLDDEALTLQVVDNDNKELFAKTYTTAELEAMTSIIERAEVMTTSKETWEGLNLWKFVLQEAGSIEGVSDPVSVTAIAKDGFSKELRSIFGLDALQNGVQDGTTYVPILLAYAKNEYPLVPGGGKNGGTPGQGFDATIGNDGGPIRLATHLNQGAALSETKKIVVKVGGSSAPETKPGDFTIAGSVDKIISLDDLNKYKGVKATYTCKKSTDVVKGVPLETILKDNGIDVATTKITLNATDNYENRETTYNNITLAAAIAQNYFVAWEEQKADGQFVPIHDNNKDGSETYWRIYRKYNESIGADPTVDWRNKCTGLLGITVDIPQVVKFKTLVADGDALPMAGIRAVSKAEDGSMWLATYGQGIVKLDEKKEVAAIYNTASTPRLRVDVVSAVCPDDEGGVWFTQNASYENPNNNQGVGYLKDGEVTYYTKADGNTIPDNYVQEIKIDADGNVWFGSFGGLTKYTPETDTWQTWNENDGFPARSIDNIEIDANGGIWCGFYPNGEGTETDPYTGGFAYFKDGVVTCPDTYKYKAAYDDASGNSMLAQVWIRDIAIDKDGGAWIVASGTRAGIVNEGGTVWYVKAPGEKPLKYSGKELLGDALDGANNAEVRMVACDADGGLWFGTSADGIIYVKDPAVSADHSMAVTAEYSKETGSWDASLNNIYSLDIIDDVVIAGSANGLAWKGGLAKSIVYNSGSEEEPEDPEAAEMNDEIAKIDIENITLDDEEAINALVKQYAEMTEEQKAQVENPQALVDAVNKIAETKQVIAETKEEIATTESYVNYKDYAADNMLYLWIMSQKAEKDIENAKSIAEAQTIMDGYMGAIMDTPSKFSTTQVKNVAAASYSFDSNEVTWDAKEGAVSYDIYRATKKNGKYTKVGEATGTSYVDTGLPTGKYRYYKVKAVDYFDHYSKFSAKKYAKPLPEAPVITSVTPGENTAELTWGAVKGATGYRIYYKRAKAKAKYVNVTRPEQLERVIKKLKSDKEYKLKIRAYTKVGKTKYYGKWSTVVKATIL